MRMSTRAADPLGPDAPCALIAGPDGARHRLGVGDLIGRLPTAALFVDDPRVSEAHAILSLRRGGLHLLSLRRMVAVGGKPVSEVVLQPGLVVELAAGVHLRVLEVHTPSSVLAIELAELAPRPLPPVASLLDDPLRIVPRFVPDAPVHLWEAGQSWRVRAGDGPARPLRPGDVLTVGREQVTIRALPLEQLALARTESGGGAVEPLRLVGHYDTVELHRRGREPLVIGGIGAQIVSELIACAGPMSWSLLARDLWPEQAGEVELRHRWDVALNRLRTKLKEAGVRADLLRADRNGQLSLVLYDGDTVEDRT